MNLLPRHHIICILLPLLNGEWVETLAKTNFSTTTVASYSFTSQSGPLAARQRKSDRKLDRLLTMQHVKRFEMQDINTLGMIKKVIWMDYKASDCMLLWRVSAILYTVPLLDVSLYRFQQPEGFGLNSIFALLDRSDPYYKTQPFPSFRPGPQPWERLKPFTFHG